jgi:hypothetical protein
MSESRDEREFNAEVELRTPAWLPGGKFAIRFSRLWDKRASNFLSRAAKAANVDEETLLQRVDEADGFFEVFQHAGQRMVEDGDPVVGDVFARLIASALHDDTRIHEVSYMLTKLENLQPLHIRIVTALPMYDMESPRLLDEMHEIMLSRHLIAEKIHTSTMLVGPAMRELVTSNFVEEHPDGYNLASLGCALRSLIDGM